MSLESPTPQLDYFRALVADDASLPLTEAAFAIAQDAYPQLDVQTELVRLDIWGKEIRRAIPHNAPPAYRLRALRQFFYEHLGFKGNRNQYYDVSNSYLHKVVDNRSGIPITLAVLLMELGTQAGLRVEGISFPGHFLVKVLPPADASHGVMDEVIIDPFTGGAEKLESLEDRLVRQAERGGQHMPVDALLEAAPPRFILVRMLRNLQGIYRHLESWRNLLAVQERIIIVLPEATEELRERGLLHAKLGNRDAAASDLHAYLNARPFARDRDEIERKLLRL
jgi:regulator of sirC expression with transglutaminase-like and TPR domain